MQDVQQLLATEVPRMRQVKTSSLHRGVSTAKHSFFQVPALENKLDHLAQVRLVSTWKLFSRSVANIGRL